MSDESTEVMQYPPFVIVGMMDYGPHIWTFETAHEVGVFMWGRTLSHYAIFKNRRRFNLGGVTGDVK